MKKPAEHSPQLAALLTMVEEMTRLAQSDSIAELFGHAFTTLAGAIAFDAGVAVLIEQHLDLYVSSRQGSANIGENLVGRVRHVINQVIPVEVAQLDVVIKDARRNLAPATSEAAIEHDAYSILRKEGRTAGVVMMCRAADAFSEDERRVLDIFAAQLSMLLDNLHARARIMSLADLDDLTGVPNRRYFRRQMTAEMERARAYNYALSVLLIDVDDFKQINDTHGHVMGDVVLSELCGSIRNMLRTPDAISRFGGDEFAVLLSHTDTAGAAAVAERLLQRVRDLSIVDDENRAIQCTVSVGITQCEPADITFNDVMRRADARLYEAKRQGKNRYIV